MNLFNADYQISRGALAGFSLGFLASGALCALTGWVLPFAILTLAIFSFLWYATPVYFSLLLAVAGAGISFALGGIAGMFWCIFLPLAGVFPLARAYQYRRTSVILLLCGGGAICLFLTLFFYGLSQYGTRVFYALYEEFFTLAAQIKDSFATLYAELAETMQNTYGYTLAPMDAETLDALFRTVLALFPSIAISGLIICMFCVQSLAQWFAYLTKNHEFSPTCPYPLVPGTVSAAVLLVADVISLFVGTASVIGIASLSLVILLAPVYAYLGLFGIFLRIRIQRKRRQPVSAFYWIYLIGILFLLFFSFYNGILLLSVLGASQRLMAARMQAYLRKNGGFPGANGSSPDDSFPGFPQDGSSDDSSSYENGQKNGQDGSDDHNADSHDGKNDPPSGNLF